MGSTLLLSRNSEFRGLCPCGSVTLWPLSLFLCLWKYHTNNCSNISYLSPVKLTTGTGLKKKEQYFLLLFFRATIYQLSTSLPSFSHVVYFDTALRQESWKGERPADMATAIFNLFFSRKKRNAEARLPGTALGQGSCRACVHKHAHTISQLSTVLRKHP